jgi:hypothetical protein
MCRDRWPGNSDWANPQTKAVFFDVLLEWQDPAGMAASWSDMSNGDAVEQLARQLFKDLRAEYGNIDGSEFIKVCCRAGLRHVDFEQVAERLLCYAPRPAEDKADAGDAEASA